MKSMEPAKGLNENYSRTLSFATMGLRNASYPVSNIICKWAVLNIHRTFSIALTVAFILNADCGQIQMKPKI